MIYERILKLCADNKIAISRLENDIGLGNGVIRRWQTSSPSVHNLKKVADYFKVNLMYFME